MSLLYLHAKCSISKFIHDVTYIQDLVSYDVMFHMVEEYVYVHSVICFLLCLYVLLNVCYLSLLFLPLS